MNGAGNQFENSTFRASNLHLLLLNSGEQEKSNIFMSYLNVTQKCCEENYKYLSENDYSNYWQFISTILTHVA